MIRNCHNTVPRSDIMSMDPEVYYGQISIFLISFTFEAILTHCGWAGGLINLVGLGEHSLSAVQRLGWGSRGKV